jgi:hypothetical protein
MNEKIREWFDRLDPDTQDAIEEKIEEIRHREEEAEKQDRTLTRMIRELARTLEELVDDPAQISSIIKALANGRISDPLIERVLPSEKKRKYKRYQPVEIPTVGITNDQEQKKPILIAADGKAVVVPEEKSVVKEIALNKIIEEKDKEIQGLNETIEFMKDSSFKRADQQEQEQEIIVAPAPAESKVFKLHKKVAHSIAFSSAIHWATKNGEQYILLRPNKQGDELVLADV